MGMRSGKLRELPLEDGKETIVRLLSGDADVSVIVEKHGNTIRLAEMRAYDSDTKRILVKAREQCQKRKNQGYSREDAFADIEAVQAEIMKLK